MEILNENVSSLWKKGKIVCVTTNGYVTKTGYGVMGRGNAKEMASMVLNLPKFLGSFIVKNGYITGFIYQNIISFPTKPKIGTYKNVLSSLKNKFDEDSINIPGFWCKSDLNIIETSLNQLNNLIIKENLKEVFLPLPGCQNGELKFEDVKPILEKARPEIKLINFKNGE